MQIPLRRLLALAVILTGASAVADPATTRSQVSSCGHEAELLAARQALAAGDREEALRHLRAADALLARCQGEAPPAEPAPAPEPVDTGDWRGRGPASPRV
jgi:hypothetical protein